jgi:hypothetical protein
MQNSLNTENPNHYIFTTKHLKIQILGGIRFNNLEAMRVTLGIKNQNQSKKKGWFCYIKIKVLPSTVWVQI